MFSSSIELDVLEGVDTSTSMLVDLFDLVPDPPLLCRSAHTHVHSTRYSIDQYVSFVNLSSSYGGFIASLSSVSIPPSQVKGMAHPSWCVAMEEEIHALRE